MKRFEVLKGGTLLLIAFAATIVSALAQNENGIGNAHNGGRGPFEIRSSRSFQIFRLAVTPQSPIVPEKNGPSLFTYAAWNNYWAFSEGHYKIDAEVVRVVTRYTFGIADSARLGFEISANWRGGGILDGFIDGFHELFGVDQDFRSRFPRNRFDVQLIKNGVTIFSGENIKGTGLEDPVVFLNKTITRGDNSFPALGVTAYLKLPGGNAKELFGTPGFDPGISVNASKKFGAVIAYLAFGYTYYGLDRVGTIRLRRNQFMYVASLEVPMSESWSIIGQYVVLSGTMHNFFEFSEYSHEFILGAKFSLGGAIEAEVGALENLFAFSDTADFGVHFGLKIKF